MGVVLVASKKRLAPDFVAPDVLTTTRRRERPIAEQLMVATRRVESCRAGSHTLFLIALLATATLAATPSGACEEYCTAPCSDLNGDLEFECDGCVGAAFACRPGAAGFPDEKLAARRASAGLPEHDANSERAAGSAPAISVGVSAAGSLFAS